MVTSRAAIVASIASDAEQGQRILDLAGGRGFGAGRAVTMQSGGMAARAARYIHDKRGRVPSDTSLSDAAAAAAAAMWFQWQVYSALVGDDWNVTTARHLAAYGWRAAFKSFTNDAAEGRTGRDTGRTVATGGQSLDLEAAQLDIERKSLEDWARDRQGRLFVPGDDGGAAVARRARRDVLRWLATVLDVRGKGRTGGAERARFSVLARLIHGRDIATAARGAGFASGRAALESFRSGKVWARLRACVRSHQGQRERNLLAARLRAVSVAMRAIRAQRAARAGAGYQARALPARRIISLTSGASALAVPAGISDMAPILAGKARMARPAGKRRVLTGGLVGRGAVHPLARAWTVATTKRGQAVAVAREARRALQTAQAARVASFDTATAGLRAGWLR
jgi:hypothetical protein